MKANNEASISINPTTMTTHTKDLITYSSALAMLVSGIVLAFLSFFLNDYDIADGVLVYIAQALVYAGSIFGVALYIKSKLVEFKSEMKRMAEDEQKEEGQEKVQG